MAAVAASAQQTSAPQVNVAPLPPLGTLAVNGGTVTGRVVCGDTQHPARFAQVNLISAEAASDPNNRGGFGGRGGARTDLDGVFTATNIAPGDYYVNASATGYISEAALQMAAGSDMASALARLPLVHVSASGTSTVNVSLERGGVVAGRVQWDDGSPAAGIQLSLLSAAPPATSGNGQRNVFGGFGGGEGGQTDDRGQFRLTGLAPGDYLLRTVIQTPTPVSGAGLGGGGFDRGRNSTVILYAPGKVRRTDAQTITVRAGEERTDLVIVLDLTALHRVTGHVSGASGTVGSGTVRLTDSQDTTLTRTGTIASDGSYLLSYVPAGTYTLSVPYASTAVAQGGGRGGQNGRGSTSSSSFQPFSETVSVTDGDLSGVDVMLMPATPPATSASSSSQ